MVLFLAGKNAGGITGTTMSVMGLDRAIEGIISVIRLCCQSRAGGASSLGWQAAEACHLPAEKRYFLGWSVFRPVAPHPAASWPARNLFGRHWQQNRIAR